MVSPLHQRHAGDGDDDRNDQGDDERRTIGEGANFVCLSASNSRSRHTHTHTYQAHPHDKSQNGLMNLALDELTLYIEALVIVCKNNKNL